MTLCCNQNCQQGRTCPVQGNCASDQQAVIGRIRRQHTSTTKRTATWWQAPLSMVVALVLLIAVIQNGGIIG